MLSGIILLSIILYFFLARIFLKSLAKENNAYAQLNYEYEKSLAENKSIKSKNSFLEKTAEEIITLYDVTKDMRKILDEDNMFKLFKERVERCMATVECLFLKGEAEVPLYKNSIVLPLVIDREPIGYLVGRQVKEADSDKFYILAQQFLAGLKGAILFKRLQEITVMDSLTQIFNRRHFLQRLREELARSGKHKYNFSFLMLDIDFFKNFNDRYGHLVGDAVLKEVVSVIKENIRQIDFMGRWGGEELAIALPETGKKNAGYVAERIRAAIEAKPLRVYDEALRLTISIGVSCFPLDAKEPDSLIEQADKALYRAKEAGRNRVCGS